MKPIPFALPLMAAALAGCASSSDPEPSTPSDRSSSTSVPPAELDTIQTLEDTRVSDERLTRLLAHPRPAVRRRALVALGRVADPKTAPAIAASLQDEDAKVVGDALWALGQIGDAAVFDSVRPFLAHPSPDIRMLALDAVGRTRQPGFSSHVSAAAKDPSARVRAEVGMALWRLSEGTATDADKLRLQEAASALAPLLGDPDTAVRWRTACACTRLDSSRLVAELEKASNDPEPLVRLFAVRALAKNPGAPLAPFLRTARDADARVVIEAVEALARRSEPEVVAALEAAAARGESCSIARAVELLGHRKSASPAVLRMASRHPSGLVRGAALLAVALQEGAARLEEVRAGLRSRSLQHRRAAARALVEIGTPEAAADLVRIMAEGPQDLQLPALEAAGNWTARHREQAKRWDPLLVAALRVNDLAVRATAAGMLKGRVEPEWGDELEAAYNKSGSAEMAEVRAEILMRLGEMKRGAALAQAALKDPSWPVREAAAGVILACTGDVVVPDPEEAKIPVATPWEPLPYQATLRLETTQGVIRIRLLSEAAPVHAWTMARLARQGFYDGRSWHRVIPNFVVQGGDPRGDGWGDAGFSLRDEISREPYGEGTVGMAKSEKDTGSCQLFITTVPTPHLDGRYTVMGRVVEGLDVARMLEAGDEILRATMEK
ncbi:MAG: HEAT repeat domain-containing protein [Candidatus Brocadiae bacterium]|nr:HEAT repeat domain-containing protein [Candidatus Brocadiia bacterium]